MAEEPDHEEWTLSERINYGCVIFGSVLILLAVLYFAYVVKCTGT